MTRQNAVAFIESRIAARVVAAEVARRARFDAAKSNTEKLFAAGVLTTCDSEQERAYHYSYVCEGSAAANVPANLFEAADEYARAFDAEVAEVQRQASDYETSEERSERWSAAVAALPENFAPGAKRACKHNETAKARGWFNIGSIWTNGQYVGYRHVCCRCGAEINFLDGKVARNDLTPAALVLSEVAEHFIANIAEQRRLLDEEWSKFRSSK
jgi:hypothetical protein